MFGSTKKSYLPYYCVIIVCQKYDAKIVLFVFLYQIGFTGHLYLFLLAIILASLSVAGQVTGMASMNYSMMTTEVNSTTTNMSGSVGAATDSITPQITTMMTPTMPDAITAQSLTPSNGSSMTQSATSFVTGGLWKSTTIFSSFHIVCKISKHKLHWQ